MVKVRNKIEKKKDQENEYAAFKLQYIFHNIKPIFKHSTKFQISKFLQP